MIMIILMIMIHRNDDQAYAERNTEGLEERTWEQALAPRLLMMMKIVMMMMMMMMMMILMMTMTMTMTSTSTIMMIVILFFFSMNNIIFLDIRIMLINTIQVFQICLIIK